MQITLRPECPADEHAISTVTQRAFLPHPHSAHNEQFIIQALRAAHALPVSLVAECAGHVVAHIAFSPVTIADGSPDWYGLGPVAVLPEYQGQGIGRALIERGLQCIRGIGAQGCVVLGEPAFYTRFGFRHDPDLILAGVPPAFFLALPFGPGSARGQVDYHAAFAATGAAHDPARFQYYEIVRVAANNPELAEIHHETGAIIGLSEFDESEHWLYGVFIFRDEQCWSITERDLMATGQHTTRAALYGENPQSLRVRVDEQGRGWPADR